MKLATRDAWDRGAAVKEAGFQWTSSASTACDTQAEVVVPMDMLRDITR